MKKFLKILQAGWVLALSTSLIHVYIDLIPTDKWVWQIFVLMGFGILTTLWIVLLNKILNTTKVDTSHESKVLNIPRVSNSVCEHKNWHRAGFTNIGVCDDCGANIYINQTDC